MTSIVGTCKRCGVAWLNAARCGACGRRTWLAPRAFRLLCVMRGEVRP